ncbi:MAG: EutN/CcmL family microcompartment protein [Thermincolia bacterium]
MIIGKVINSIWSTRKIDSLTGIKLMIVQTMDTPQGRTIVAADFIGAGIGERVLITQGGSARRMHGIENAPVDAVIIGIIDENQEEPVKEVAE